MAELPKDMPLVGSAFLFLAGNREPGESQKVERRPRESINLSKTDS